MSATATAPAGMVIRDGDAEPSCAHCRYFTGHTSWCPAVAQQRLEADYARPARRVDLYTASAQRIRSEVTGRAIRVTLHDGFTPYHRIGRVERVENGRTVVRFTDGRWAYGPSGRITVH